MGKGQYAQPTVSHVLLRRHQACFCHRVEWDDTGVKLHESAGLQHRLRRALAIEHAPLWAGAQHRHALAIGVEGDLVDSLLLGKFAHHLSPHTGKGYFHRVAEPSVLAVLDEVLQVMAERGIDEQFAVVVNQSWLRREVARFKKAAAQPQALNRHAILRQCAGLVATDRRR